VLRQGLKRQIRLMLYKVGYEVKRLIRMRIGPLRLTELRAGEWRLLTPAEVKALQSERPEPLQPAGGKPARSVKRTSSNGKRCASSTPRAGRRP